MNKISEKYKGVIFDLDGTLLDTSWVWEFVDIKFLGDRGLDVPEDYVDKISPMGAYRAAVYTIDRFGLESDTPEALVREWFDLAKSLYSEQVKCKPHAAKYIEYLYNKGIKMAVATSSDRELFMSALERENIIKYFDAIVTVDEVKRGKGYPDVYLEAASRLELTVDECIVFEDILTCMKGAKSGGFIVAAVEDEKTTKDKETIMKTADYYIDDYGKLL